MQLNTLFGSCLAVSTHTYSSVSPIATANNISFVGSKERQLRSRINHSQRRQTSFFLLFVFPPPPRVLSLLFQQSLVDL